MKKKHVAARPRPPASQLGLPGLESVAGSQPVSTQLALPGLEPDCLLAFLALVGLLRSLESARPRWHARISWSGPPWLASLHVAAGVSQGDVAAAAVEGIEAIASHFNVFGKADVVFAPDEYRRCIKDGAPLLTSLCAEAPRSKDGKKLLLAPLVMMFGQGHQHFLSRLISTAPRANKAGAGKKAQPMQGPDKIEEALFARWKRSDRSEGFRWDPEEDQRYALRFRSPSADGAAPTVHGANRLACIGLLTFVAVPNEPHPRTVGARRDNGSSNVEFVWPIWSAPISLLTLEALLVHPDVIAGRLADVRALGVTEIYTCRRVQTQRNVSVARARPASQASQSVGVRGASA